MQRTLRILAVAAVLAALAGAACGKKAPSGAGPGGYEADDLIVQVDVGGGFVPREYALRDLPEFTLSGDGRVFTLGPQIEIYPPPAMPPVVVRRVTERAVGRIVAAVRDAGLDGPDKRYDHQGVADAPTTTFVYVDGNGVKHTVSAYALGEGDDAAAPGMSDEDRAARKKLAALRDKLFDLSSWIDAEDLGEEQPYEPEALRIFTQPYPAEPQEPAQQPKAWPLDTPVAEFGAPFEAPATRCGVVDGDALDKARKTFQESNTLTPWTSDGKQHLIVLRPLLPGESGCPKT